MEREINRLIIVEGPKGVGKTTVTNWLREQIPYSNLYRLTGHKYSGEHGRWVSANMYANLMQYIENMEGNGIDMIFDRSWISESVYCRMGLNDYEFGCNPQDLTWKFLNGALNDLTRFKVIIINLVLDPEIYKDRLNNREPKAGRKDTIFDADNSVNEQMMYNNVILELMDEYPNLNVWYIDTSNGELWKEEISDILDLTSNDQDTIQERTNQ